ncbi:MAG: tetratricopeptide repeat protein [Planctomycetes bacterium]|nr:tetratricopeptide repeat protein [Planctomycetota bacterium]
MAEAQARVRTVGRPLFVVVTAAWEGYSRRFRTETLADPSVVGALRDVEVLIVDLDGNPGALPLLGFPQEALPALLLYSPSGEAVWRVQSHIGAEEFLRLLAEARGTLDGVEQALARLAGSPDDPEAHRVLGRAALHAQDPERAEGHLLHAARLAGAGGVEASFRLVDCALLTGRNDVALARIDAAVALDPDNRTGWVDESLLTRAKLLLARGETLRAEEELRALAERFPEQAPEALFYLGVSRLREGDAPGAKEILSRMVREHPASPRAEEARRICKGLPGEAPGR